MLDLADVLGPSLAGAVVACICLVRAWNFAKGLLW